MRFQLPNGLIDGQDYFNFITVDELTGEQQDYLADKDLVVGNMGHIEKIMADLIKSLETKEGLKWKGKLSDLAWKLPATDLESIMIKIREETFGNKFYHEGECNHCGYRNKNLKMDLAKLEFDYISLKDLTDAKKRTVRLPKSKKEVELKPLYLKDLFEVLKVVENKTDKLITSLSALSVKKLGDISPVTRDDIKKLSARDIAFLGQVTQELKSDGKSKIVLEGSIDTYSEFTCQNPECKKEAKIKLNVFDPDFFDHSKAMPT
jgi:phage FluMu protein gp41